jgi:P27 family predicted phage terminase small subunit
MSGPPPTPIRLRLLRGNPGKRPISRVFEPPRPAESPEPPDFLHGDARAEWDRVAPGLFVMELLTAADVACLAAYCQAFAIWKSASIALDEIAQLDAAPTRGLLIKGSEGQARPNPLLAIASSAARDMVRYAGEFGFSPAARSRISAGPVPAPTKFVGLIG